MQMRAVFETPKRRIYCHLRAPAGLRSSDSPATPRTKEDLNACAPRMVHGSFPLPDARMAKQEELTANSCASAARWPPTSRLPAKPTVDRGASGRRDGYSDSWISGIECSCMNSDRPAGAHRRSPRH